MLGLHFRPVPDDHFSVSIVHIVVGCEDFELPMMRPDFGLHTLHDAQGSHITWPRAWVSLSHEVSDFVFMFCYRIFVSCMYFCFVL